MMNRVPFALCVLMAASLFSAPCNYVQASSLPDDTGQTVQALHVNDAEHVLTLNDVPATILQAQVVQAKDSTFNPRTDFPKRPAVITAGFASFAQECCGGSGSWNYAEPQSKTLLYLGAVVLFSVLLATYVHRKERRQTDKRRMAIN